MKFNRAQNRRKLRFTRRDRLVSVLALFDGLDCLATFRVERVVTCVEVMLHWLGSFVLLDGMAIVPRYSNVCYICNTRLS